jgi:hypothetical protein
VRSSVSSTARCAASQMSTWAASGERHGAV